LPAYGDEIVVWGHFNVGQETPPAGNDFTAVAAGMSHGIALKSDGSIVGWGHYPGEMTPPSEDDFFTAIVAGENHSLALKSDGSIFGWGYDYYGAATPPSGIDFVAIAAGSRHSLALRSDGSIVGWGVDPAYDFGQAEAPTGNDFTAVAAGVWHSLALKNGSIVGWGNNTQHQITKIPAGNDFTAVATGWYHGIALKSDRSVVCWGDNRFGQATPPSGNDFTAVAAGNWHSLALKSDGSIVSWGNNWYDQVTATPAGNDFTAIAAGSYCSIALVYVQNTPPVADAGGPYLVATGQSITLDGSDSHDPDGDPLTDSWVLDGPALGEIAGSTFTAFDQAGVTYVTLAVDDGRETDLDTAMLVVYDPDGGFVTGGGWIDSPLHDDYIYMGVEGKANFGFVSKYKKGAQVPTGNTEFVFHAANLNFHSSSYQWLVVNQAGANAQFKGTGTINGEGNYKFMLWAGDGEPDTFRIKIWEELVGVEIVYYDNGVDQPISGGSIIVHKGK